MTKSYAGVGSRATPVEIQKIMYDIAQRLASKDYILRSGGAEGADLAFEEGCGVVGGKMEIYLPWPKFNGSDSPLTRPSSDAVEMASTIHPAWSKCSSSARLLHGRNAHQVLGANLDDPVEFLICWTLKGETVGGTATAINLAIRNKIPIYNLATDKLIPNLI